jgi:hypothetical protein
MLSLFVSARSRLLFVALTGSVVVLCALVAAGGAVAAPGAITGLTSTSHPNQSQWYSDANPVFTWNAMAGVVGYSYELDTAPVVPLAEPLVFGVRTDLTAGARPWGVATGDLNDDGVDDIVSANWADGNVSVILSNGDGTFADAVNYEPDNPSVYAKTAHSVAIGDIDGDGVPDIAVTSRDTGKVWVMLGAGDGTFDTPVPYDVNAGSGGGAKQVVIANFDESTTQDEVAVASASDDGVRLFRADTNGVLQTPGDLIPDGASPEALAVGDFNGDTHLDLAVTNWDDGTVTILLGNGDGTFAADPAQYTVGDQPHSVVVGYFNGNANLDLAVANYSGNSVSVLLGNGDGTFADAVNYDSGLFSVPSAVAAADFDGDGNVDLAVTDWNTDNVKVVFGAGDGTFDSANAITFNLGDAPNNLAVGDFDDDGTPDIVAAQSGSDSNTVGVLMNVANQNPPTTAYANVADGTWVFSVRAVDAAHVGGPTESFTVNIDTTKPTTTTDGPASSTASSVTVHLTPHDSRSGVAATKYRLDGGDWADGTSFAVSGVGVHTYDYYSVDNQETTKHATLKLMGKPKLGRPHVPATVKRRHEFTIWGTLKPQFPAGSKTVKIKVYKRKHGKWVYVAALKTKNVNLNSYSKYTRRGAFKSPGLYRVKAYSAKTTLWVAATSKASRTFRVK